MGVKFTQMQIRRNTDTQKHKYTETQTHKGMERGPKCEVDTESG